MNSLKSLVFLTLLCIPVNGFCQIHRERSAGDHFDYNYENLGKSKHSSINHEKWKKIAKKRGASFYYYNVGTTSYKMGVNSTLNTGDSRYFVHYYNLNPNISFKIFWTLLYYKRTNSSSPGKSLNIYPFFFELVF